MDLIEDLNRLGGSSEEVAVSLKRKGIRGMRQVHECCPVANYLRQCHPGHRFEVANLSVQIDGEGRCRLPVPVRRFIEDFDSGKFPDLIDLLPAEQEVKPDA